jgi:hypothetical protein
MLDSDFEDLCSLCSDWEILRKAAKKSLSQISQIPQIDARFARIGKYYTELHREFTEFHRNLFLKTAESNEMRFTL